MTLSEKLYGLLEAMRSGKVIDPKIHDDLVFLAANALVRYEWINKHHAAVEAELVAIKSAFDDAKRSGCFKEK